MIKQKTVRARVREHYVKINISVNITLLSYTLLSYSIALKINIMFNGFCICKSCFFLPLFLPLMFCTCFCVAMSLKNYYTHWGRFLTKSGVDGVVGILYCLTKKKLNWKVTL